MINYRSLFSSVETFHAEYTSNMPFPNIYIDEFLDFDTYKALEAEALNLNESNFKTPENPHVAKKSVQLTGELGLKEETLPTLSKQFVHELNSGTFLKFLEKLSGISGLLPDPYLAEGGYHVSRTGGFLDIHADFSHHDYLGLERRLNLLFYFNEGWDDEFGGALGLYDEELNLIKKVSPLANRLAIFTTSDNSFHGFPEPMNLPKNRSRISLALYYYTVPTIDRKKSKILFPKNPNFVHQVTRD